jgi:hypothetical protein
LQDHSNHVYGEIGTMYCRERGPWHFIRKVVGKHPREAKSGASLAVKKAPNYLRSYLIGRLALTWAILCVGAPTRIGKKLVCFLIPRKKYHRINDIYIVAFGFISLSYRFCLRDNKDLD